MPILSSRLKKRPRKRLEAAEQGALVAQAWPSIKGTAADSPDSLPRHSRNRAAAAGSARACGEALAFLSFMVIEALIQQSVPANSFDDDRSSLRLYRVHRPRRCSGGDARCPNCGTSCAASACVRRGSGFRSAGCCSARATGISRPKCCSTRRPGPASRSRWRPSTTPCTSSRKPASCASSRWTAPSPISTPIPASTTISSSRTRVSSWTCRCAGISVTELPEPPGRHGSGRRRGDRPPAPQGCLTGSLLSSSDARSGRGASSRCRSCHSLACHPRRRSSGA